MHPRTAALKKEISRLKGMEARFAALKGAYAGEKAFAFSCGPSFQPQLIAQHRDELRGRLVFCIKQAFNSLAELCDFHVLNYVNHRHYRRNPDGFLLLEHAFGARRAPIYGGPGDLECSLDPSLAKVSAIDRPSRWLLNTQDFDTYRFDRSLDRPWGPGIVPEVVLYLALHLGIKELVFVGWDVSRPPPGQNKLVHFYDQPRSTPTERLASTGEYIIDRIGKRFPYRPWSEAIRRHKQYPRYLLGLTYNEVGLQDGEMDAVIAGSGGLHRYFFEQGLSIKLVSKVASLSEAFPRVSLGDELAR